MGGDDMSFSGVLNRNDNEDTYLLGGRGRFSTAIRAIPTTAPPYVSTNQCYPEGVLGNKAECIRRIATRRGISVTSVGEERWDSYYPRRCSGQFGLCVQPQ